MKVSIIGAGYVGLVSGVCLAEKGHTVVCVDVDAEKVRRINEGIPPLFEEGLEPLLKKHVGGRFRASCDLEEAVASTELTMIAVGTPFDGRRIDLSFVKQAAEQIGAALRNKEGDHVVVVKSTVVPGTTDEVVEPILTAASGRTIGVDLGLAMNPEFLSEGTAVDDFLHPDRIVIGCADELSRAALRELYTPFTNAPRVVTTNRAAEMIKYASNCLLATLISFSNEIGNLCEAVGGIDAKDVFAGLHLSQYLSPALDDGQRNTAPIAAFLDAGCGFGGSCLPKDTQALVQHGREFGETMQLLEAVIEINQAQPRRMIGLLQRHYSDLCGLRVAVLGLAFKPGTTDVRESPALALIRLLHAEGAVVKAHDPIANDEAASALAGTPVEFCERLDDALADVDAVLLVTRWDEFAALPEKLSELANPPLLVDGRRMIDPRAVPRYEGIGRGEDSRNSLKTNSPALT